MKIALIADALTSTCLKPEAQIAVITPLNYKLILRFWKPDCLFVESAWQGHRNAWRYKIAAYPDYPERTNKKLAKVVAYAKSLGIPTLFWSKEDHLHFDRFIDSAKLFDHILTVDESCLSRYRAVVAPHVTVETMMFAVQPAYHSFTGFDFKENKACFAGSYSTHIHERRRAWQDMLFKSATSTLGLTVFDRNSGRKSKIYRYPVLPNMNICPAVPYEDTATLYKNYVASLNVNTIEDSPTMFSRRLIEILACGGIAVTSPSLAVETLFKDYCHVVRNAEEACTLFERLKNGPTQQDLERARAGSAFVLAHHTWAHRLKQIEQIISAR